MLPKQLNNLHITPVKVQSLSSTQTPPLNIDLSLALKATKSLPNFTSNKNKENLPEKFEIPYIDGDYQEKETKKLLKQRIRPCTLNVCHLGKESVLIGKKPSRFGKVLIRNYRNLKGCFKMSCKLDGVIPKKVKVFKFNTQSPDDYIGSHLSR